MPRYSEKFAAAVRDALGGLSSNQASYKTGLSQEYIRRMQMGLIPSERVVRQFAEGLKANLSALLVAAGYEEPTTKIDKVRYIFQHGGVKPTKEEIEELRELVDELERDEEAK